MRAFRDELPSALGGAREAAAAFLGVPADSTALVRNVTEARRGGAPGPRHRPG